MKMSKPGVCCDACFEIIACRNARAAMIWIDLCDAQIEFNIFGLKEFHAPEGKVLEDLGYIITTDDPMAEDVTVIKVMGRQESESGTSFCTGRCLHD